MPRPWTPSWPKEPPHPWAFYHALFSNEPGEPEPMDRLERRLGLEGLHTLTMACPAKPDNGPRERAIEVYDGNRRLLFWLKTDEALSHYLTQVFGPVFRGFLTATGDRTASNPDVHGYQILTPAGPTGLTVGFFHLDDEKGQPKRSWSETFALWDPEGRTVLYLAGRPVPGNPRQVRWDALSVPGKAAFQECFRAPDGRSKTMMDEMRRTTSSVRIVPDPGDPTRTEAVFDVPVGASPFPSLFFEIFEHLHTHHRKRTESRSPEIPSPEGRAGPA